VGAAVALPSPAPAPRGDLAKLVRGDAGAWPGARVLQPKAPRWNAKLGSYVLNFFGRVKVASVKNCQLVVAGEAEAAEPCLAFGKVSDTLFALDFAHPLSPLQAFAIALAALEPKLACE